MVEHQFIKCINDKPHIEGLHLWYRSGWHGHIWANDVLIKPCSYLASRLALCPKGPKRAFTWASTLRSTIGCVQNDFWATVCSAQTVHYLAATLTPCPNGSKLDSTWSTSRRSSIGHVQTDWEWVSTWASSPRSTIGCIQNDFWANGMFGANRAPVLHRH